MIITSNTTYLKYLLQSYDIFESLGRYGRFYAARDVNNSIVLYRF